MRAARPPTRMRMLMHTREPQPRSAQIRQDDRDRQSQRDLPRIRTGSSRQMGPARSRRVLITAAACLLGALLAASTASSPRPAQSHHRSHEMPVQPGAVFARAQTGHPKTSTRSRTADSPRPVALVFTQRWLACTDHQGSCTHLPGALPAYNAALRRAQGSSLPTPAELAARVSVQGATTIRACRDQAVVTVSYSTGRGLHYLLHVNLARRVGAWRVFDVAEVPPHIPLPAPLGRGPGEC
jgi:hypothetical protein